MFNLIIAYDLDRPGSQNYEAVRAVIKSLGDWYQLQYSLLYVQSELPAEQAYNCIRAFMDPSDKLLVSQAFNAVIGNYPMTDIGVLRQVWAAA